METKAELNITVDPKAIPEGIIKNAVAVAITNSLDEMTREQIITDVVRAHLNHKVNTYDKDTILSKAVGDSIRAMVKEALSERLAELKPKVHEVVTKLLGPKFNDQVYGQLETALQSVTLANISLTAKIHAEDYE